MSVKNPNTEGALGVSFVSTYSNKHGGVVSESLGPEALAGDLNGEFGQEVSVEHQDLQLETPQEIRERIAKVGSSVVGISVKIGALEQLEEVMEEVESLPHKPLVVLGGVVPTFASQKILEKYPQTLVAIGEAELTMRGLVHYLRGRQDLEKVPGLMRVDENGLQTTPVQRLDLKDQHLPARITTQRIYNELNGLIWFEGSRGCDWHCTFCSRRALRGDGFSGDIRPSHVVDDLENLNKMGIKSVHATDDDWGGDPERTLEIAEDIIARGLDIKWSISTRADHIWKETRPRDNPQEIEAENERLLYITKKQIEAGLDRVFLGLESFSPSQLKRYGKQISVEANYKAVAILQEIGVDVVAGYIPIDPLMDLEELQENLTGLRNTGMYKKVTNPLSVLRVQEGSPYLHMVRSREKIDGVKYLGERTEDLVFYDIENFKDSRVQIVADLADEWVTDMYPLIFGLKMNVFASTQDSRLEDAHARWSEEVLHSFRELEMSFIENVTKSLLIEPSGSNLQDVTKKFKDKRSQMVQTIKSELSVRGLAVEDADFEKILR